MLTFLLIVVALLTFGVLCWLAETRTSRWEALAMGWLALLLLLGGARALLLFIPGVGR